MISIDCQVRNKSNIHEGISAMCEEELMDGENKVGCDRCNKKTNTVLRTAVSKLSDVLVLSLKRFDLDYTTFETVKINSRYEFEETLNMKQYTLEAKELLEAAEPQERKSETGSMMDLGESDAGNEEDLDPLAALPDEDYEYLFDPYWVSAYPYRVDLSEENERWVEITVRNFRNRPQKHEVELKLPAGVTADPPILSGTVPAKSRKTFPVKLMLDRNKAPEGLQIITLDITLDDKRHG